MTSTRLENGKTTAPPAESGMAEAPPNLAVRPFWLSVIRWTIWFAMLMMILAFAAKRGGEAFIYQNF